MLAINVVAFGLAWWFGLYLIARNPAKATTLWAGIGLVAYAAALACQLFDAEWTRRLQYVLVGVPGLAWTGVLLGVLPQRWAMRRAGERGWRYGLVPLSLAALVMASIAGGLMYALAAAVVLVPLAVAVGLVGMQIRTIRPSPVGGLVLLATLLFGLGAVALLVPLSWLPPGLLLASIGVDLLILGAVIGVSDAFDEGESFLPELSRSLLASFLTAVLFGSQVGVVTWVHGPSDPLRALLVGTVATAIAIVIFAGRLAGVLDWVVFVREPVMRSERGELRSVAEALPRRSTSPLAAIDDDEFARLTRQALRHYADLGKLASNPLVELPIVGERLAARGGQDDSLERARELKALVLEGVQRLKPPDAQFGTADEWRHYNALYFFYIVNIRPYRNHPDVTGLDEPAREALQWFRQYVPERTLYNWQQAATKVVAMDLKARGLPEAVRGAV